MDRCATKYTVRINNGRNDETGYTQLGNRIKDHQHEEEDKLNYTTQQTRKYQDNQGINSISRNIHAIKNIDIDHNQLAQYKTTIQAKFYTAQHVICRHEEETENWYEYQ